MGKIKTFFYSLKRSLTDPNYYREIAKIKFGFSLKYLFFLLILTSLLISLSLGFTIIKAIPQVPGFITQSKAIINNFYPKDLEITITNGALSTNVQEPYFIKVPPEFAKENIKNMNLITIDTSAKVEDIKKYNTAVLVTKNAVVYPDKNNQYKIAFLNQVPNSKINKQIYDRIINKALPYSKFIAPFLMTTAILTVLIMPFIIGSFSLFGKLIYLLIVTVPLFLLSFILKNKLSYGKVYQLSMHGLTFSILIQLIIDILKLTTSINFYSAGYSFILNLPWLTFFVWMIVVLSKYKKTS